jgi:hypothetical protein
MIYTFQEFDFFTPRSNGTTHFTALLHIPVHMHLEDFQGLKTGNLKGNLHCYKKEMVS